MSVGITFAGEGGSMRTKEAEYTTLRRHLHVDMEADPPHLDIVELRGTNIAASQGSFALETLLTIKHGLPFKPHCMGYFYVKDHTTDPSIVGAYADGAYYYSGAAGTIEDKIFWDADDTNFYIQHRLDNFSVSGTVTSTAARFLMRVKYFIFSNPHAKPSDA